MASELASSQPKTCRARNCDVFEMDISAHYDVLHHMTMGCLGCFVYSHAAGRRLHQHEKKGCSTEADSSGECAGLPGCPRRSQLARRRPRPPPGVLPEPSNSGPTLCRSGRHLRKPPPTTLRVPPHKRGPTASEEVLSQLCLEQLVGFRGGCSSGCRSSLMRCQHRHRRSPCCWSGS